MAKEEGTEEEITEELLDENEAEYSRKSEYSKAAVVQQQVQRCNELRSKEMSEGHTMHILDKQGNLKIIDIPDGRQPYINSVIALTCNLKPEINRDSASEKKIGNILEQKDALYKKYVYKEAEMVRDKDGKPLLKYTGREYIPKKGAILTEGIQRNSNGPATPLKTPGLWDSKVSAYWDELVFIYDELFAELNVLIDKCGYFKEQSGW